MRPFFKALVDELQEDEDAARQLAGVLAPYLTPPSDDAETWTLDAKQKAAELGVHPDTLGKWARAGRIPAMKVGRELRFRRHDLPEDRSRIDGRAAADGRTRRRRSSVPASVAATLAAMQLRH